MSAFHYPIDLHYSQTSCQNQLFPTEFHYPIDLHYSQTHLLRYRDPYQFHYPIDLHYSQTMPVIRLILDSFITL